MGPKVQAALTAAGLFATQQHIIMGMPAQLIIIGMPAFIIVIICSQQAMNMVFIAGSMQLISQDMPLAVMVQVILPIMQGIIIICGIIMGIPAAVQHMVMPAHEHIIGMPEAIMADICWQQAIKVSCMAVSMQVMSHFMPAGVMAQLIFAIM